MTLILWIITSSKMRYLCSMLTAVRALSPSSFAYRSCWSWKSMRDGLFRRALTFPTPAPESSADRSRRPDADLSRWWLKLLGFSWGVCYKFLMLSAWFWMLIMLSYAFEFVVLPGMLPMLSRDGFRRPGRRFILWLWPCARDEVCGTAAPLKSAPEEVWGLSLGM